MAYTRQDLITLVLQNVGVLAAGQEASLEDRAAVDLRIDPKLAELAKREIITGLNADALDPAVFLHVADIIASACRVPFGITGNKAEVLTGAAAEAEASLKLLSRQYSATAATDAFDVVRHVLEALGVVTVGQDPSAQDRGVVTARVAPMLADLRSREIIAFTDLAAADAAHRRHLATILTASCAPAFGVAGAALVPFVEAAAAAERQLRALARQFDTGTGTSGTFNVAQTVIELLGVVEGGQTASAKDVAVVSARFAPLLADLRARHIADLASVEGTDDAAKHFLAAILAARCAPLFGVGEPMLSGLRAEEQRAEAALRASARQFDSSTGTSGTLDAPQAVLEILGVVEVGQSASAKDRSVVLARLPSIFADLKNRELVDVVSFEAADASVRPHLVTIITAGVAPLFIRDAERLKAFNVEALRAEDSLRQIARQLDSGVATGGTFDLIQVTLENLGAVAVGRTATDKDRSIISGRVTAVLDDLRQREVISIPSLVGANPSTLLQLSVILTSACAMAWGIPADVRQALRADAERAEIALRAQARQLDTGAGTGGTFDLPQAVLEGLGVIAAGQTASAKDRAVVQQRIAPTLADLRLREIVNIASIEGADPGVLIHLSVILTSACSQAFGKDANTRTLLAAEAVKAEAALKALARQLDKGSAVSGRFDPVQVALEQIGIVSAGQSASAADRAVIDARVQPKLLELHGRDICGVTDLSLLSPELQGAFARILAADCALSFSEVPPQRLAFLQAAVPEAERILRYQSFVYDARRPMRLEAFWGRRHRGGWCG